MEEQTSNATRRFFGTAMMAVGAMLAGLSGLCTLGFAGIGLATWANGGEGGAYGVVMLVGALMSGVVPILIGVGLYFGGKGLLRPKPGVDRDGAL